jgi:3-oxoacyl-[acyl-carrier protein] reductase
MLKGKIAVITGASRGIGRAIARDFAGRGARVVVSARNPERFASLMAELEKENLDIKVVQVDVASEGDAERLISAAVEFYGRIDILVNNAGITKDKILLRMREQEWDDVLSVNLKGTFLCTRAASRVMSRQRYGRIVNIASVVGEMGNPGQANYCASKAGVLGLTRSNARELARRNITVNAVAPGFIATDMTDELSAEQKENLSGRIPAGHLGLPEDIAHAVAFLASDAAAYITGQILGVNGGMHM